MVTIVFALKKLIEFGSPRPNVGEGLEERGGAYG